jgi:hypothetical protein
MTPNSLEPTPMKTLTVVILLAASLLLTGCDRPKQGGTEPNSGRQSSAAKADQSAASEGNDTSEELSGVALSRFNDAKIYCLGMMLYAAKNQNYFPTNLDQTLPGLREADQKPSGTNRFDILFQGAMDKLPNPMTNGIIVLRSQPWQGGDGRWTRVYGFADGHCEVHSEADGSFDTWEKQRLVRP